MKKYKTYAEKLRDPRWQKKRLKVLNRDEWECQLWTKHKGMKIVHHKYYLKGKEPWQYPMKALITLCENCNKLIHPERYKNKTQVTEEKEVQILTPIEKKEEELNTMKARKKFFDKFKDDPCDCEPFQSCEKCSVNPQ